MLVSDVMTHTVVTIDVDTTVSAAAELMRSLDIHFLPVTHEGICAGVLTDRDIVLRVAAHGLDPSATKVGTILTENGAKVVGRNLPRGGAVASVRQDAAVEEAQQQMEDLDVHHLAVHNDDLAIVGVVSLTDLERPALAETT